MRIFSVLAVLVLSLIAVNPANAKMEKFPSGMRIERIKVDGATIYARAGGQGPAVLLRMASPTPATCGRR